MIRTTLSLPVASFTFLLMSCDQVVSPEASASLDGRASAALVESKGATTDGERLSPASRKELAQLRRATVRNQDVAWAEGDGYHRASPFVPQMGFHYVTPTE